MGTILSGELLLKDNFEKKLEGPTLTYVVVLGHCMIRVSMYDTVYFLQIYKHGAKLRSLAVIRCDGYYVMPLNAACYFGL